MLFYQLSWVPFRQTIDQSPSIVMSCQIPLLVPSAPSIVPLLAERLFVRNYLINMILSAFRAMIAGFFPCSEGANYRLPRCVEQRADDRRTVDLARVGVDPTVVHRLLSDDVQLLLTNPDVAQPGRQTESRNQLCNHIRRRLVGLAERLADSGLFFSIDQVIEAQHMRQHYAGGVAVRDIGGAAQHMPDAVARPFADTGLRADHRHPRTDLTVETGRQVRRLRLDRRQTSSEQPQRMIGGAFGDRLAVDRADVLDRVIDGTDAGRQKEPLGCVHGNAGIENDAARHHQRMAVALLDVTRGVGAAGRRGELAGRQCRRDRDRANVRGPDLRTPRRAVSRYLGAVVVEL